MAKELVQEFSAPSHTCAKPGDFKIESLNFRDHLPSVRAQRRVLAITEYMLENMGKQEQVATELEATDADKV